MKGLQFLMLIILLAACASGHREPYDEEVPPVRDLEGLYGSLDRSARLSPHLSLREIGTVRYGRFESPILCVLYKTPDTPERRLRILIDGGIHGDEPAGVAFASQLVALLAARPTLLARFDLDIIPVVNPWGWSRNIRFNKDGIDINRDFSSPRSKEATIITSFLNDKSYDLVLDLHEDPEARGVYFYQYGRGDTTLLRGLVRKMESWGYPIENDISMILLKTDNGIIDAPMWGLWYVRLTNQLSMSNYCRLNISRNVFTLETPTTIPLEKRIFVHRAAVSFLADSLHSPAD